jgi:hypothetical protein
MSYNTLNFFSFCRYTDGITIDGSSANNVLDTITNSNNHYGNGINISNVKNIIVNNLVNCCNVRMYGLYVYNSTNCNFGNIINLNNETYTGLNFNAAISNVFGYIGNCNNNNDYGIYLNGSDRNLLHSVANLKYNVRGISFMYGTHNIVIMSGAIVASKTAMLSSGYKSGWNFIKNVDGTTTEWDSLNGTTNDESRVFSINHLLSGYDKVFMRYATVNSQASTLTNGSGKEWRLEIINAGRDQLYPVKFPIAKIAVAANAVVTVKLWMKKSHATNIVAGLVCMENQIAGLTSRLSATKSDNTIEEEVTLTLDQPTEAGVIEIEVQAWWGGSTANVIFDKLTVSQA